MENNKEPLEIVESEVVETNIAEIERFDKATVDIQIATAKRYPRDVKKSINEAMTLATLDEDVAAGCMYAVPRDGKNITGKSVGLAKICAGAWGNMRVGNDVLGESEDRRFVMARGFAFDLEKNYALAQTVRRRITDKRGTRYKDDMIQTTGMAAGAIAMRNCILNVLPQTFTDKVYEAAKTLAVGDVQSLRSKKENATKWMAKYGVSTERLLTRIKRNSMEEVTVDDMEEIVGFITSMRDGMDPEDLFPIVSAVKEPPTTLQEKVAAKAAEKTTALPDLKTPTKEAAWPDKEPGSEG